MLFLDQPTQVGFSYDVLANYTNNFVTGEIERLDESAEVWEQNATFRVGTYPSQDRNSTARGTRNAAIAMWHFAQVWFQEFPGYHPKDSRISIATESYGGRYGPGFASFFQEQNEKIINGTWNGTEGTQHILNLDTLLIINGCIDRKVQWPSYPQQAYNNTYGLKTINQSVFEDMTDAFTRPGGCRDQIDDCRALAIEYDPDNTGINETVNHVCATAESWCSANIRDGYLNYSGRNYYDIGQKDPDPFTFPFYVGWLNQPHVQAALGVPLNFTQSNGAVSSTFRGIGDYPRPGWLEDLAYLLERGIKVALVYGDRDYACNWFGGEAVSLAIDWEGGDDFAGAGYAPIRANESYVGGQVRQYGNLSFSRVYDAGHEVPAYQPETAYAIFTRALFNRDIATGEVGTAVNASYATEGPSDTLAFRNELPEPEIMFCYVYDLGTCTDDQIAAIENGTAVIKHWIVKDANSMRRFPELFDEDGDGTGAGTGTGTGTGGSSPTETGGASPAATNAATRTLPASINAHPEFLIALFTSLVSMIG